ncbi:hypothetical protein KJZ99_08135 [bacterium]|nr:hypothetical protein [bacterium]
MTKQPQQDKEELNRMIHIRVSDEAHRQLRIFVARRQTTAQKWLTELVMRELEREKDKS